MGSVHVSLEDSVIHARYMGDMTMELVREAQKQIENLLGTSVSRTVLYNTLAMEPTPVALAVEMKRFDASIRTRVKRCATVVATPAIAFLAKVAFALSPAHRVFYSDLDGAIRWLNEAI
jgi:hypothetical protein